MAHWSFLLCNQENSSLEIQSCQIRCFHQGIVPAEVAHVFGNPAPAGKPCYLAEGTRCSPYILHKCSVFHIYQKVWEIILFSILLLLLLAIKHPPSRDVSISWCWPHKELCFIITVWNPLSEAIWLRLYNDFLTERIEGDAAGKKKSSALQVWWWCWWWWCLWKCFHAVQYFPLFQEKFPKHNIVQPAPVFYIRTLNICKLLWTLYFLQTLIY